MNTPDASCSCNQGYTQYGNTCQTPKTVQECHSQNKFLDPDTNTCKEPDLCTNGQYNNTQYGWCTTPPTADLNGNGCSDSSNLEVMLQSTATFECVNGCQYNKQNFSMQFSSGATYSSYKGGGNACNQTSPACQYPAGDPRCNSGDGGGDTGGGDTGGGDTGGGDTGGGDTGGGDTGGGDTGGGDTGGGDTGGGDTGDGGGSTCDEVTGEGCSDPTDPIDPEPQPGEGTGDCNNEPQKCGILTNIKNLLSGQGTNTSVLNILTSSLDSALTSGYSSMTQKLDEFLDSNQILSAYQSILPMSPWTKLKEGMTGTCDLNTSFLGHDINFSLCSVLPYAHALFGFFIWITTIFGITQLVLEKDN